MQPFGKSQVAWRDHSFPPEGIGSRYPLMLGKSQAHPSQPPSQTPALNLPIHQPVPDRLAQPECRIPLRRVFGRLATARGSSDPVGASLDGANAVHRVQNAITAFAHERGSIGCGLLVGDIGRAEIRRIRHSLPHIPAQFHMAASGHIRTTTKTFHGQPHN